MMAGKTRLKADMLWNDPAGGFRYAARTGAKLLDGPVHPLAGQVEAAG